jgi:hypothetical protein
LENLRLRAIKSFYNGRDGLITLEDDVLSVVTQVRELYGDRITVEMDPDTGYFHFIGHENGTDYLIFTTPELDPRALDRLQRADQHSRAYADPLDAVEREQDELSREKDLASMERIFAAGERLAWAMGDGKFGPGYKQSIAVPREINAEPA